MRSNRCWRRGAPSANFTADGLCSERPPGGTMIDVIDLRQRVRLDDYAGYLNLSQTVRDLRSEAAQCVPALAGRKVWMVNSTAVGGGVAEMMPTLVSMLRELGVATEWAVLRTDRPEFFVLTKRLHNLI